LSYLLNLFFQQQRVPEGIISDSWWIMGRITRDNRENKKEYRGIMKIVRSSQSNVGKW
jgi:hypothetical protein